MPFLQEPSSLGAGRPAEFWNQVVALMPPRPWRELPLVVPLAVKYEYIGLMSRPFTGVTSGARMTAQSSPRSWNRGTPKHVLVANPHCLPTRFSSTDT